MYVGTLLITLYRMYWGRSLHELVLVSLPGLCLVLLVLVIYASASHVLGLPGTTITIWLCVGPQACVPGTFPAKSSSQAFPTPSPFHSVFAFHRPRFEMPCGCLQCPQCPHNCGLLGFASAKFCWCSQLNTSQSYLFLLRDTACVYTGCRTRGFVPLRHTGTKTHFF